MLGEQLLASSHHLSLSAITTAKVYALAAMDVGLATGYDIVYNNTGLLKQPTVRHKAAFRVHTAHAYRIMQEGGSVAEPEVQLPTADQITLRRLALTEKWGDGLERWALRHDKNTHMPGGLREEAYRVTQLHHDFRRRGLSPLRHQEEVRSVINTLIDQRVVA